MAYRKSRFLMFSFLICVSQYSISIAQTASLTELKQAVIINRLVQPIIFDGVPDDEAWSSIDPVKMIMHSPVFGKEPTESTVVRIGYDDRYLYFGASLHYSNPEMLRSASLKRDYMGMGGDWFGVILDTYNDKENGLAFFTSPDALRWDATILKDAVTQFPDDMPMNISWNTFWDVQTKIDSSGWSAEMKIPFSSLRFQDINGEVRMGLIVQRWIPSKNETDIFPAIPPNWGQASSMKPSQAQEVVLRGVKPGKPLYIAPYVLAGYESNFVLNSKGSIYNKSENPVIEAGLDLKYGITDNLTMDLTVNTDFTQVESDDQQINLTRFSMYYPEKRMFFLERASVFDFSLGGYSNLFYSRRIGLSDDGDPVRIYGGARITGRAGKWDIGVLDMQTAPLYKIDTTGVSATVLPSENFGTLRFRRQFLNDNSYIGVMMTSRLSANGKFNLGYGIDALMRLFNNDYLDLKWSQTFENNINNNSFDEPTRIMARWERRSSKGLGYNLGYSLSGIHFNPGIGFEMMDNFTSVRAGVKYGWLPGEKSKLYSHSPEIRFLYMSYIDDGSLMSLNYNVGWTFQTKNQWLGSLNIIFNKENLRDSLEIIEGKLFIRKGNYEFVNFMGTVSTPATKSLFLIMRTDAGQYFGGTRFSVNLQPTWNVSKHLEIGTIYNYDRLKLSSASNWVTNHIIGVKAIYMLDTRLSLNAFVQYNTAINEIMTNLRLRFNPKEGNDFYIVLNEGRNTNLTSEVPRLPVYNTRSLLVKYTYTFNL